MAQVLDVAAADQARSKPKASSPGSNSKALELVEIVASGTSCSLWKGVIRGTGQVVTVKTLKQKAPPKQLLVDFEQEAALLQRFSHPHLVRFYGARLRPPRPCIVLETSTIGTLRHVLELPDKHPLDWKQKLQLALDAASGLAYLHRKGHTHGDVKSHTLLVFESQGRLRVKVAEFGQPRFRVQLDVTPETDRLQRSLAWEAPESFCSTTAKLPPVDVYSFGMVCWELTTRRTPYAEMGAYGTRQAIASGNIPPMPPAAPPALRELYHACCNLQAHARPSMDQVVTTLEKLIAEGPDDIKTTARGPQGEATPQRGLLSGIASHASTGRSGTGSPAVLSVARNTSPVPALKLKTRHSKVAPPVVSMPVEDDDSDDSSTPSSMMSAASNVVGEQGQVATAAAAPAAQQARPMTPPLPPAPAVQGDAQAALAAVKQLGCKQTPARVATFAQHGQPQRNQMVKAGAVPRLVRMLCASEAACHKAALATLLVLLEGPEGPSDQVGPPKRRGFRALLLKVHCMSHMGSSSTNEAGNQLVEGGTLRSIARIITHCVAAPAGPQSPADGALLRMSLAVLLKLSQYHVFAPQLAQYPLLRTVVNVLHAPAVERECDALAVAILTQLAEVAPTSIPTPAALGMVKALVKRLENPDAGVSGPAAHLLAQVAVSDDVRLAIAKEGPVDVPVTMLNTLQLVLPASELLAALGGCTYLKQILGSRKAVTALANLLPIHIPLTADLLNALVVLCSSSPSHVRMMLDAGALPWLLAFAAGSSTPSADPLNRRGAATAPVAGPGVPADDWPIVRMFAAELLDMVGDMVDERSGQHYLMQFNGVAWLTRALNPPAPVAAVPLPSARHPAMAGVVSARPSALTARSARPNVTLDEACTSAQTYAALALSKLACATTDCHAQLKATGALSSLLSVLTGIGRPMEARTAACRGVAAIARNNEYVDELATTPVLRALHELLGARSSLWARRTAVATLAALARRKHMRQPIVDHGMVPLLVLLLKDNQAMPHSLDTLLSLALHPELLLEVADSGVVPRLLAIATGRTEGCAPVALQLVQEICTLPAGRVNVAREDGARVLARLVQEEQPAALADPALHALSLLGADNLHTPLVHKENIIGLLVDAAARPDWPARDTTLHALAQLASIDAASQYAVVTAGVVPVLLSCMMDGNPAETRAAAAKVVTAICNHNKPHQLLLVGRNVMPPLVAMLAGPTTPQGEEVLGDEEVSAACLRMQGAAIRALVVLTTGNSAAQEAAREAGGVAPAVALLVSAPPKLRASAALVMANLTFDDVVKQAVATDAQPGSATASACGMLL